MFLAVVIAAVLWGSLFLPAPSSNATAAILVTLTLVILGPQLSAFAIADLDVPGGGDCGGAVGFAISSGAVFKRNGGHFGDVNIVDSGAAVERFCDCRSGCSWRW